MLLLCLLHDSLMPSSGHIWLVSVEKNTLNKRCHKQQQRARPVLKVQNSVSLERWTRGREHLSPSKLFFSLLWLIDVEIWGQLSSEATIRVHPLLLGIPKRLECLHSKRQILFHKGWSMELPRGLESRFSPSLKDSAQLNHAPFCVHCH